MSLRTEQDRLLCDFADERTNTNADNLLPWGDKGR